MKRKKRVVERRVMEWVERMEVVVRNVGFMSMLSFREFKVFTK